MTQSRSSLSHAILISTTLLATPLLFADEPDTRHGAVEDGHKDLSFEGGITLTGQHASDGRIDAELSASLDLVATLPMGPGLWTLYVEGNTTPRNNGVSSILGEVNTDIGSALDEDGSGRLQVSELHYAFSLASGELVAGLIDASSFLDASEVANDETAQFLGAGFVNNPTIEFPDYSLGAAWHYDATADHPGLTLLLASSHGLADNDGKYGQLFDLGDDGKGAFAAAEAYGYFGWGIWRLGAWSNTADHTRLDGSSDQENNWGLYGVADGGFGETRWNLRLGWADASVSESGDFIAITLEQPAGPATLGAGIARTGASSNLTGGDDSLQAELYARFELTGGVQITPDLQWIRNSGLDGSGSSHDRSIWVAGVRAGYTF
jgi:hypothetical protein